MGSLRRLRIMGEKAVPLLIFFFTPTYFAFMMTNIRGPLVEYYQMGALKHAFHILLSSWCFINILGNMIMTVVTDTAARIPASKSSGYCKECKKTRPAKTWHCFRCNVCILRRDHHCYLLSRCIGLYNIRYFIMYVFHIFISMLYSTYYLYLYVSLLLGDRSIILSVLRLFFPILQYCLKEPWNVRDAYFSFLTLNVALIIWSAYFLCFHLRNVLMGVTAHDSRAMNWKVVRAHWKENIERVFGDRWYFTVFWPFTSSPLPMYTFK